MFVLINMCPGLPLMSLSSLKNEWDEGRGHQSKEKKQQPLKRL